MADVKTDITEETPDEEQGLAEIEVAAGTIGPADYAETMGKNFLVYSVAVITDRALPSIDGLKPVQRRILLAMRDRRLWPNGAHSKCAKVVGDTMGMYHPHGDSSIYGALVNMAQDWTMRVPLVDGQGNFGAITGDGPAAYRYTECRIAPAGMGLIEDLDPEILPNYYGRNFDESLPEPKLLPARFPNLLINGVGTGIAVGMTCTILPHNPGEMLDLCAWRLKNPEASVEKMLGRISGPDFPTGATVVDDDGLRQSYLTGKGKVTVVSKAHIEPMAGNREKIVITEVPWGVNVGSMLEKLVAEYKDGKFPELTHLANYPKGDDVRIEAELKRDSNAKAVLQRMLTEVGLRKSYGVEMNVLINGVPKTLNLAEIIDHYLSFRREIVINRAKKRIGEIEKRLHKLEAYMKVIDATDKVVQTIKKAKDRQAAKPALRKLLKIDEQQAEWIVEMPLGSLTALDRFKLKEEVKELTTELKHLQKFIKTPEMVTEAMTEEFGEVKAEFKKAGLLERKTTAVSGGDAEDFSSMTTPSEDCILLISRQGQGLCGQGTLRRGASLNLSADDRLAVVQQTRSDQERLIFSGSGKVFRLRLAELPLDSKRTRGQKLSEVIGIESSDTVAGAEEWTGNGEEREGTVVFVSRKGMIKRTSWADFNSAHSSGIVGIKVAPDDEIIAALDCPDDADVVLVGSHGKSIRFKAADARPMGRSAGGVRGIKLPDDAEIVGAAVIKPAEEKSRQLMLASDGGFGKRIPFTELPVQGRGGGGVALMKVGGKYGKPNFTAVTADADTLYVEVGGGRTKHYPASRVPKAKRAIVPKRWPSGEHAIGVIAINEKD